MKKTEVLIVSVLSAVLLALLCLGFVYDSMEVLLPIPLLAIPLILIYTYARIYNYLSKSDYFWHLPIIGASASSVVALVVYVMTFYLIWWTKNYAMFPPMLMYEFIDKIRMLAPPILIAIGVVLGLLYAVALLFIRKEEDTESGWTRGLTIAVIIFVLSLLTILILKMFGY